MTILTQGFKTAEFLVSEANGCRSRGSGTVDATGTPEGHVAGTVLGQRTADGVYAIHDPAAADGTENPAAILYEGIGAVSEVRTLIERDAEINTDHLTFITTITPAEQTAALSALAALGLIER